MTQQETCSICGQPKASSMTGSFTQWVSACRCETADKGKSEMQICALCGKQIDKGNTGSFTQWVLQSQNCSCENPVPLADASAVVRAVTEEMINPYPVRKTVESELSKLTSEAFPLERYKPIDKLGAGGGGSVYLCFDKHLRKNVAVKISSASMATEFVNFQTEAKVTAKFRHPNIVSIIDFGLTPAGAPFMVLEYVDGISLDKFIQEKGRLQEPVAISLFVQIARAIEKGHESGIFHRDIKSSNILITEQKDGTLFPHIIDFGIAMMSGQDTTSFHGKNVIGTPKYMSPDQLLGRTFDARSEIYSFACVMYETLTGSLPFSGDALTLLEKHSKEPAPPFVRVNPQLEVQTNLEKIVLRCLEKDPDMRFNSMRELAAVLESLNKDELVESSSVMPTLTGYSFEETANILSGAKALATGTPTSEHQVPPAPPQKTLSTTHLMIVGGFLLFICMGTMVFLLFRPETNEYAPAPKQEPVAKVKEDPAKPSAIDMSQFGDVEGVLAEAGACERSLDFANAEAAYSRAIELEQDKTKQPELFRRRGITKKYQGDYDGALRDFNKALKLNERDTACLATRADYYRDCGQIEKALEDAKSAHQIDYADDNLHVLKARIWLVNDFNATRDDVSWADEALRIAIRNSPNNGLAHAVRIICDYHDKRYQEAEDDSQKAKSLDGNNPLVMYYCAVWDALQSNWPKARDQFDNLIKAAPYMWEAYKWRAICYVNMDEQDKALESYRLATRANPKNADLYYASSTINSKLDHTSDQVEDLTHAISLEPRALFYKERGDANLLLDKPVLAAADFQNCLKLGRKEAEIYKDLGTALSAQDKFKEAIAAYTKAIELKPDLSSSYSNRARAYDKLGDTAKAYVDCQRALELKPNDPVALRELSEIKAKIRDKINTPNQKVNPEQYNGDLIDGLDNKSREAVQELERKRSADLDK